ncbi:peptidoglycan DD-metalloendopeptidase family protein [Chryseobacterium sp. PBS4-4]|uniref:Peptidoglycan DD-metalloendopeptidase family protein n=1 Tax=Chryseobacterium edaphi TaxID=2976532 RepID=A0ABT2WBE4_9FLAO|nr:peptidoglycan DD-metalloendopeptidase family protein [Chryseobacterium edaphi]MCU7618769.1 peptidoglycan DD-metalloendopeptidase family protein [Chryseobacterium edaphi]
MFAYIIGSQNPVVGKAFTYEISSGSLSIFGDSTKYGWYLFKKQKNGSWRDITDKPKMGRAVTYTFHEPVLGNEFELRVFETKSGSFVGTAPTKKQIAKLDLVPSSSKTAQIDKVILLNGGSKDVNKANYRDILLAQAFCTAMFNRELIFTLWEDDAKNSGHNKNNKPIATKTKKVDKNGTAVVEFTLIDALMRKAMQGESDVKQLEFYITVEYYVHKKHSTNNININNPFPAEPRAPQIPSRPQVSTPSPQDPSNPYPPTRSSEPLPVPKVEGSPAEQKAPSKKEEHGIKDVVTEHLGELWDSAEILGKAIRDQLPTISTPEGVGTASVKNTIVEALLDAYFAKEEFTKETNESAGNYTYKFLKDNARVNKDEIAGIIKGKIEGSLRAEKKYVKLNDIKNALSSSYVKDSTISFAIYKLGVAYKKITNSPLEDDVFVVAQTMKLDGKQVTVKIKEKEALLVGDSNNVSVLEAKENGNEVTELKAMVQDGIAKVKVKLRPKSDEDLKKWKEKIQVVKDGTHTYTFGGNNDTSNEAKKKSVAQVIVGKVKQQLASSNKFAKAEDIVTALNKIPNKTSYGKDEQITFDVYKSITEQWWLKAECTGEKKHEGEFLRKEGAYFTIGKKCECEARIRAFMRVIRVAEGTGEYRKGTKEARNPQLGYTTWFSGAGNNFTLSDDHPRKINSNSTNTLRSSAAGAYQIMSWKFDELNGYEIIFKDDYYQTKVPKVYTENTDKAKKYNAKGFSQVSQDKLCVIILEALGTIEALLKNDIKGAISKSSGTWVSLPGATAGQPTAKMQETLDYYDEFLKEELSGKSHLHIKPGFLKEFNITCQCQQQEESNGICPDDCSQCFDYADVVANPRLNNQSNNVNKNRFHRVKRYNNSHPRGYYHTGVDVLASLDTELKSLLCGEILEAYDTGGDLGKIVTIKSKDRNGNYVWIRYCHLNSISVTKGQTIKHGKKMGKSGNTGNAVDVLPQHYHVHIEASTDGVFKGGQTRIDPEQFMKTKFDETLQGNPISN